MILVISNHHRSGVEPFVKRRESHDAYTVFEQYKLMTHIVDRFEPQSCTCYLVLMDIIQRQIDS